MKKKIKAILVATLAIVLLLIPMAVFAGERISLNDDAELIIGDPVEQSSVPSSEPPLTSLPKPPVPKPKPKPTSSQPVVSEESSSSAISWDGLPPPSSVESGEWSFVLDDEGAKDDGNTYRPKSNSRGNDTLIIFFKDNWWWMVGGILVCIIVCVILIIRKNKQ